MRIGVVNHSYAQRLAWLAWPGPDGVIYRQSLFYAWLHSWLTHAEGVMKLLSEVI